MGKPVEPEARPSGAPAPSASEDPSGFSSEAAKQSKANAELLQEMFRVVFMREPKDRSEFGSYVDSLNQGASLEGIYNGFTHSSEYRKIEMANTNASPEALKLFARELAALQAELPEVTPFDERSGQALAMPVQVGVDPAPVTGGQSAGDGVNVIEYGKKEEPMAAAKPPGQASPAPVNVQALSEKYATLFVGSSIYTLKRVLGDEALKVVGAKKQFKDKLALWYSKFAVRTATMGVDFGISQRSLTNEDFHFKWAFSANEDRVSWEILNRLHRLLNEANRQKQ
jgi:hypothetical protein